MTGFPVIPSLANRVRAPKRKLHRRYTEYFAAREVNQLCEEWADAKHQHKPLPDAHAFIQRVTDASLHHLYFTAAFTYLDFCRLRKKEPEHKPLLDALLPWLESPCIY